MHVRTDLPSAQLHPTGARVERAHGGAGRGGWGEDPAPARGVTAERGRAAGEICPAAVCARLHYWGISEKPKGGLKRSLGRWGAVWAKWVRAQKLGWWAVMG